MNEYFFSVPASIEKDNFNAVVYGGGVLFDHPQWRGGVIFDLSSTTLIDNTPVLLNHDRDKESGFSNSLTVKDNSIVATGKLLSNEFGTRIKDNAEQGFQWQLSPHIVPHETYQLKKGESAVINGITVKHPVVIFKNNSVREISFTPVGVDSTTSATIFNLTNTNEVQPMDETTEAAPAVSLLSKIAAMLQLAPDTSEEDVLTAVKTLIDSAMKAEEDSREFQLKEAFSIAGKEYDKSKAAHYFSMPADTFNAVIADLASIKPKVEVQTEAKPLPANLFHLPQTTAAKPETTQAQSFDAMTALEQYNKGAK